MLFFKISDKSLNIEIITNMSTLADAHALFRHFSDVTLVSAEGQQATIHPLILVARSTFVRRIFFDLPDSESHPVIYLPNFSNFEVNQ